jgi:hypothetical protein
MISAIGICGAPLTRSQAGRALRLYYIPTMIGDALLRVLYLRRDFAETKRMSLDLWDFGSTIFVTNRCVSRLYRKYCQ